MASRIPQFCLSQVTRTLAVTQCMRAKMAARLQAASASGFPILLDYKPAWGHTPVQPFSTKIEALTDRLAFICRELRINVHPRRRSS